MAGSATGQLLALLCTPLLTRLYSPTDFSEVALLVGVASFVSVICTMRYEVAILLPSNEKNAVAIAGLAIFLAIIINIIFFIGILLFESYILKFFSFSQYGNWLFLLPLFTLLIALFSIVNMWNCRKDKFRNIAIASLSQQVGYVVISVIIGLLSPIFNGLVIGRLSSQLIALCALIRGEFFKLMANVFSSSSSRLYSKVASEYRQFPLFNMPYSLLGVISRETIIVIFSMTGSAAAAGSYALVRTIFNAPVGLISSSVSPVFYREAAVGLCAENLQQRTLSMFYSIVLLFAPLYTFFAFWSSELFAIVFGEQWSEAGEFFGLMAPVGFMMLLTSWPERSFEVAGKQHISLGLQFFFDALSVALIILMKIKGAEEKQCIAVYATTSLFFHLSYLAIVFVLMRLSGVNFFRLVSLLLVISGSIWMLLNAVEIYFGNTLLVFFAEIITILSIISLILISKFECLNYLRR